MSNPSTKRCGKSGRPSPRKSFSALLTLARSRSKKLFLWRFSLNGKDYTIELYNSVLSGKKKIC